MNINSSAPQIGFDRFIQLAWVASVLKVRAGTGRMDALNELLNASVLGKEARAKTRTKLNALGLQPRADLADFVDRGRTLVVDEAHQVDAVFAFAWGVAIATYPFFAKVAEFAGRLTALQGDCSVAEIHRRMSEVYGDREVTKRATQAVLQTQANWGALQRAEKGKRIVRLIPTQLENDERTAWLIEAALRSTGQPVSVSALQSLPFLFPFTFSQPLAYVVSNSRNLELRSEGPSNPLVALCVI
jgi:hypothetical protein